VRTGRSVQCAATLHASICLLHFVSENRSPGAARSSAGRCPHRLRRRSRSRPRIASKLADPPYLAQPVACEPVDQLLGINPMHDRAGAVLAELRSLRAAGTVLTLSSHPCYYLGQSAVMRRKRTGSRPSTLTSARQLHQQVNQILGDGADEESQRSFGTLVTYTRANAHRNAYARSCVGAATPCSKPAGIAAIPK